MSFGIVGYASYLPAHRLAFAEVAAALGTGSPKGSRIVAGFDEDSTTMAVEAARAALAGSAAGAPDALWFATTSPAYAEKTNAAAIHAALGLGGAGFAVDLAGSARSGTGAMRAAAAAGGLAVFADVRIGLPGSAQERENGDGAAAFLFGPAQDAVAVEIGAASLTAEFLDRWRAPGQSVAKVWEERFGQEQYTPLIAEASRAGGGAARVWRAPGVVGASPRPPPARPPPAP
ncbi:MAG: hydroxymethylglutaryl-CoA synthase, partial [Sporichthyaceae bacterium]